MKIKSPPKIGIPYVDACFQFDYEEFNEPRRWHELPAMREIPDLAFIDKKKALIAAETALQGNTDYSFLYYWTAKLRGEMGYPGEPQKTYLEGLHKGRNKPMLCGGLAMWEFQQENLAEAVKWWIQSCAIQMSCRLSTDSFSLLNLAYIAEGLQIPECQALLYREAQALQSVKFDSLGAAQRYQLAARQGNNPIKTAIKLLCVFYTA